VDRDDDAVGGPGAGPDEDRRIEPPVAGVAGDQADRAAHRVLVGRDRLAGGEACHHLGRAVTQAAVLQLDERTIVGLEQIAGVELDHPVGPHRLPVGADADHPAVQQRTGEGAAGDRDDPAQPGTGLAGHRDGTGRHREVADVFEGGDGSRHPPSLAVRAAVVRERSRTPSIQ
jgi:hypothetical protein